MTETLTRRTVLLAAPRAAYLVGPISGLQLISSISAVLCSVVLTVTGPPGWPWLVLLITELAVISCIRRNQRNGWYLLAHQVRAARRQTSRLSRYEAINVPRKFHRGTTDLLFSAAPGRLARAGVSRVDEQDVFTLPRPRSGKPGARQTLAWHVEGPAYQLLDGPDQDHAISRWASAINTFALTPGLIGVTVHHRTSTADALTSAHAWHREHRSDAVPLAREGYQDFLAHLSAQTSHTVFAATFDARLLKQASGTLQAGGAALTSAMRQAGISVTGQITRDQVQEALLAPFLPLPDGPTGREHTQTPKQRPIFPSYQDTAEFLVTPHSAHTALSAVCATAIEVDGNVLAPLMAVRPGVQVAFALTIRPIPPERTQARTRVRQLKLRRQQIAADTSPMSGLLIDTHRLQREMASLHQMGAQAARGHVETELVIHAVVSGSDRETVAAATSVLIREAAPLRFTSVAYPTPTVLFTLTPLGGLL